MKCLLAFKITCTESWHCLLKLAPASPASNSPRRTLANGRPLPFGKAPFTRSTFFESIAAICQMIHCCPVCNILVAPAHIFYTYLWKFFAFSGSVIHLSACFARLTLSSPHAHAPRASHNSGQPTNKLAPIFPLLNIKPIL